MKQTILNHLHNDYTEPIRDPVWKNIYLSGSLLEVTKDRCFQKLNRIKQLGPAYLVYPGATHTRLNHSLGVFALAHRLIKHLVAFEEVRELSVEGVKSFLCAALLHDLGHYPFAHSLKDINIKSHEELTSELIMGSGITGILKKTVGVDPLAVAAIIDEKTAYSGGVRVEFYRRLLSGVLDPDKLDYLNRDAYFCGVPYGIQDVDFILGEVQPVECRGIGISEKGLSAVEGILFAKYLMYKSVYWHKTVRIATAMIKKAVIMGLKEGIIKREELYGPDDNEFFSIVLKYGYPPFELLKKVVERNLYKLIYRTPFDDNNPIHRDLTDVKIKDEYERKITGELGKTAGRKILEQEVIIDVPEPISFEIDLSVYPEKGAPYGFAESSSIFRGDTVKDFTGSLRSISLLISREHSLPDSLRKADMDKWFGA
ncbi:MAG: HD domain-containing protein [Spirochaetes bacterium]|nr:HD domain-containing protein [Spirochaetota bacterium]